MLFLGLNPTLPVALKGQKIILKGTSLFLKYGAIPDAFSFIFLFFSFQQQLQLEKKCRWCAFDSNLGPQESRRRQNHGAMVATQVSTLLPTYLEYLIVEI